MNFLQTWSARAHEVRAALGVTPRDMAGLLQVKPDEVEAWEGDHPPGPRELERYARLIGVEMDELFKHGVPPKNQVTALFRAARDCFDAESPFHPGDLMPLGAALPVGEFLRLMRRIERLDHAPDKLALFTPNTLEPSRAQDPWARHKAALEGGRLAHEARAVLGLGDEPIASMVEFLEGLGVWVFAGPALPSDIDAAAVCAPKKAGVLVRTSKDATPWRLRVTLAHELCHLLHDRAALGAASGGFLGVSPKREKGWYVQLRLLDLMEVRARSFAASFVAPLSGVKALLGASPTASSNSAKAIRRVCDHFGVGRTVAINQICNAFFESRTELWSQAYGELTQSMLGAGGRESFFKPREPLYEATGHPRFARLVVEGLERGVLSRAESWEFLGRRLGEPLVTDPALTPNPRWLQPFRAPPQAAVSPAPQERAG